jgi:hypothetical protein
MFTRSQAQPFIAYVLTDALSTLPLSDLLPDATLVGWQCGFEPMVVAVQSYMPRTRVDASDAEEIAADYLAEIGWFSDGPTDADFIIEGGPANDR